MVKRFMRSLVAVAGWPLLTQASALEGLTAVGGLGAMIVFFMAVLPEFLGKLFKLPCCGSLWLSFQNGQALIGADGEDSTNPCRCLAGRHRYRARIHPQARSSRRDSPRAWSCLPRPSGSAS
jgi:hypothetical protein